MAIPMKQTAPIAGLPVSAPPGALADLLFTTSVIYGPTGSWKTSQLGEFAKYIYQKTGKKTRLISMDGGGHGPVQPHINAGIMEVWRVVEEENPKVAIIKASKGGWPRDLKNGLRTSPVIIQPLPGERAKAMKDIGAIAVEGWSSIAKAVMRDMVSKGQKVSEEIVGKFTETTEYGEESFGAPGRSHYGFVQNFIQDMIRNFSSLPVERVIYTALEGKGVDKISNISVYGPEVAGSAITAAIPALVGDCLHFEDFTTDGPVDPVTKQVLSIPGVRGWFCSHPDTSTKLMWPAKSRLAASSVVEFKKRMGASGYFDLSKKSLFDYFTAQDDLLASASETLRGWKEEMDARRKSVEAQ